MYIYICICVQLASGQIFIHMLKIYSFSCQESGDMYMQETSDLSISSVAHSLMYTAKYKLSGENLPPYGASRGINICDHNS